MNTLRPFAGVLSRAATLRSGFIGRRAVPSVSSLLMTSTPSRPFAFSGSVRSYSDDTWNVDVEERKRQAREREEALEPSEYLKFRNLSYTLTNEEFAKFLDGAAPGMVRAEIAQSFRRGKGFAMAEYESIELAEGARANLHETSCFDRTMFVAKGTQEDFERLVESNDKVLGSYSVFVGGLPLRTRWQDLKDHMKQAGEVQVAEVFNIGGNDHMFAVVRYPSRGEAEMAVRDLNGSYFNGESIFVRKDTKNPNWMQGEDEGDY